MLETCPILYGIDYFVVFFWGTAVVVISTISNCDGGGRVGVEVLFECSDVH